MKVIVVGATGTIGKAIVAALTPRHEVVPVSHHAGAYRVDLADPASIANLYRNVGHADAVVSAAGLASFGPLTSLTDEQFALGLKSKLMGQVNLVRLGMSHVNDGGSFTLTSGILARQPTPGSAAISLVNAGLEAFARAAALEMPRSVRINVVSPPWVSETLAAMSRDPAGGLPAARVARAYVESIEGSANGTTMEPA
jgi:NAD(P)-dependent dehydrogenase (short-subunit alcohol dehydrogenase family)